MTWISISILLLIAPLSMATIQFSADILGASVAAAYHPHRLTRRSVTSTNDQDGVNNQTTLRCIECVGIAGLGGCLPVRKDPVTASVVVTMCFTVYTRYTVGGIAWMSLSAFGGNEDFLVVPHRNYDGTCVSNPRIIPYLSRMAGPAAIIQSVQVCGCTTDMCNVFDPEVTGTVNREQPEENTIDDGSLKCDNCVSIEGFEGCNPFPRSMLTTQTPEICLSSTMRARLGQGTVVPVVVRRGATMADASRFMGTSRLNGRCRKIRRQFTSTLSAFLPPGATFLGGETCGCNTNYCNRNSTIA